MRRLPILLALTALPQVALSQSSTTINTFPYNASLFSQNDTGFSTATKTEYLSTGQHTSQARVGTNIDIVADGSGIASGPTTADYALGLGAIKKGFASATAPGAGEIDTIIAGVRQDEGDADVIQLNGALVDRGAGNPGFMALIEGVANAVTPGSGAVEHNVGVQIGVINTRDVSVSSANPAIYGLVATKQAGTGGTAILAQSTSGSPWTYGLAISQGAHTQLVQRSADAALVMYPVNSDTNPFTIVNTGPDIRFIAGDGNPTLTLDQSHAAHVAGDLTVGGAMRYSSAWTSFTPSVGATSGSLGSYTATGRYTVVGRTVDVQVRILLNSVSTASGGLTVSLPTGVQAAANQPFVIAGRENAHTGKMLQAVVANQTMTVFNYDNSFPGVNTADIILSGSYELGQ